MGLRNLCEKKERSMGKQVNNRPDNIDDEIYQLTKDLKILNPENEIRSLTEVEESDESKEKAA